MNDATIPGPPASGTPTPPAPAVPPHADEPRPAAEQHFAFTGRLGPLFRIVLKNALLTLVTLGIYRFWAKTELRRYFWGHTVIDGEPLEYTGRGLELFLGFLVVVAILGPATLAYDWALTAVGMETATGVALQLAYIFGILCLIHVAVYRMWRYRLTRTTWRGIRFGLDGAAWRYMLRALGWTFLSVLTLGIAVPWMDRALWAYRIDNTRFGTAPFRLDRSANALRLLPAWLLTLAAPAAIIVFATAASVQAAANAASPEQVKTLLITTLATYGGWLVVGFLVWLGCVTWYQVVRFRLFAGGVRFGDAAGLHSRAHTLVVLGLVTLYWFLLAMAFALFGYLTVTLLEPFFGAGGQQVEFADAAGIVFFLLVMFMVVIVLPIINVMALQYGLISHFVRTLSVTNPEALRAAVQATDPGPARGEGLADALDVGAF